VPSDRQFDCCEANFTAGLWSEGSFTPGWG
jgi:hypothetical protein